MTDARTARWQKITLATLFVGYSGYYVCRSNLSVATTLILADFPGAEKEIGIVASVGVLLYALGKISNGILADFLGGRKLFLTGMLLSIVCTVLFGMSHGMAAFALIWGVNQYVQSMGWGAMVKIASRWYPFSVHATVMGFLSLSYLFGDALVRLYLGYFIQAGMGWRGIFFVSAATLGVVALVTALLLKASPGEIGAEEPPADPANLFGAAGNQPRPESLARLLIPLLTNMTFWLVCCMNVGLTLIRESCTFWTPTYLKQVLDFSDGDAAQGSMLFPLAGAAGAILGGWMSDRLRGRHALVALPALVLLAAALLALGLAPLEGERTLTLALIAAAGFFLMAPYSFCSGVIALNLGGKQGNSTAAGLIDAAGYFGAALALYGVPVVVHEHGWPMVFLILTGAAVLTTFVTCLYWLRQPPRFALPEAPAVDKNAIRDPVNYVLTMFRERGSAAYLGEQVSQSEHALQSAWAAEKSNADAKLIAAALLHDIGHLLHALPENCAEHGIDDGHEDLGARWVDQYFGAAVSEPIRLHVPAKRYLCTAEPEYSERLSEASQRSLRIQGGPFSETEARDFLGNPHAAAAVRLRRWDEEAKTPGLKTPDLEHFRPYLETAHAQRGC